MAFPAYRNSIDGALTDVVLSTSSKVGTLGERAKDNLGNEFIYLSGVASTAAGDWVVYDETFATVRLTKAEADKLKPMAIAMGACVAGYQGWYQIAGEVAVGNVLASCVKEVALYTSATAGSVDDTSTSQTKVNRAIARATRGGTDGSTTMLIQFPSAA